MIAIAGLLIGAATGALAARRKGGRLPDLLQYAAAFGILGALLGVFATIAIGRMLA